MRSFFSAPRKFNLRCTVNRCSGSTTIYKNIINKKRKVNEFYGTLL